MRLFGKSSSETEMKEAGAEVVAEPPPVEESSAGPAPSADEASTGWWKRFKEKARRWVSAGSGQEFAVKPEWSRGLVIQIFEPLAKHSHPAWRVTIEEADKLAPEMQAFLQEVADRYTPAILAAIAARHPAVVDLVIGLLVLTYAKSKQVRKAEKDQAKKPGPVSVPAPVPADDDETTVVAPGEKPPPCEVCGVEFETFAALSGHLPCPGRK